MELILKRKDSPSKVKMSSLILIRLIKHFPDLYYAFDPSIPKFELLYRLAKNEKAFIGEIK